MDQRVLRGTRLGAISYETDDHVALEPRRPGMYVCPRGHRFEVPFAASAEAPAVWECRLDGTSARRDAPGAPEPTATAKPARTHWDMLMERRSLSDLEVLLIERLQVLRSTRGQ